jgi:hypothetical protein
MTTYIWKTKTGQELDVDKITDINHLRNIIKLLMRNNHNRKKRNERKKELKEKFTLHGDMANQFNKSFSKSFSL